MTPNNSRAVYHDDIGRFFLQDGCALLTIVRINVTATITSRHRPALFIRAKQLLNVAECRPIATGVSVAREPLLEIAAFEQSN